VPTSPLERDNDGDPGRHPGRSYGTLPAIELVGLVKSFTSHGEVVQAVKGIDMKIAEGEFFSMLGPSGCGKTTTMRMIAGFDERPRASLPARRQRRRRTPEQRDVNMVFQSYALFPHMSVAENVAFGLKRKGVAKEEVTRRVGEMLEIVGLTGREKRRPKGAVRRSAAAGSRWPARWSTTRGRCWLDEPLAALDLKLRQAMQVELKTHPARGRHQPSCSSPTTRVRALTMSTGSPS